MNVGTGKGGGVRIRLNLNSFQDAVSELPKDKAHTCCKNRPTWREERAAKAYRKRRFLVITPMKPNNHVRPSSGNKMTTAFSAPLLTIK